MNIDLSRYADFDDFVYIKDKFYETYNIMLLDISEKENWKANATKMHLFRLTNILAKKNYPRLVWLDWSVTWELLPKTNQ